MSIPYVLDAYALVEFVLASPGSGRVCMLLEAARDAEVPLRIGVVNLCEVAYILERRLGLQGATRALADIAELPVTPVDANADLAMIAAKLKAEYALGLGDAFAAALALELDAPLLTGDPDFRALPQLNLEWIGE